MRETRRQRAGWRRRLSLVAVECLVVILIEVRLDACLSIIAQTVF